MLDQKTVAIPWGKVALIGPSFVCQGTDRGLLLRDVSDLLHEDKGGNDHADGDGHDHSREHRQQQDAAVGTNLAGIEDGSNFLLANTWQGKREKSIVSIGEHGTFCPGVESGVSTYLYIIPDGCTMPTSKSLPCS